MRMSLAVEEGEIAVNALAAIEMDERSRCEYENLVEFLLYREH